MQAEKRGDLRKSRGRWNPLENRTEKRGRTEEEEICFDGGEREERGCLTTKKKKKVRVV